MASKKNKKAKGKKGKKQQAAPSGVAKLKASFLEFWDQKSPVLKFLLGVAACMIIFYIIYLSPFFINNIAGPIINTEAKIGHFILSIFGHKTIVSGDLISSEAFSISVKNGCDGLEPLAILLSGILVFPVKLGLKIPGLIWGSLALMVLNFFRIAGLYLAGLYFPMWVFDLLHEQGGFVIFTALSIFIWMFWANWAIRKSQPIVESSNPA